MSNAGLYRCFDKENRYILKYVYYLIPITPIYESIEPDNYPNECEVKKTKNVWRLDAYNQYRFFPRLLVNSDRCKKKCGNYVGQNV